MVRGMIRMICLLLAAGLCAHRPAHAAVIVVSPAGSIQDALDRAQAGDTVHLRPGVYRERVKFTRGGAYGKPLTLEGEPGAIIDGSAPVPLDWQPAADVAPGVWRARVPFPVFTLTADGKIVTMLREDRVRPGAAKSPAWEWPAIFRNGVGPSGWSGVKALALYLPAKKEILLRFQGDRDPRQLPLTIAPREPVVRVNGADRCVVRGLTLRNAAYGVRIERSLGSVVEQCTLGPVDYGVWLDRGADRCTIRFNEMFMNPYAGADPHQRPGSWDNWQAHKTGGHYDRYGVEIANTAGGHEVHDNDIHDDWDGIEDRGEPGENRGLRIHHNRIFNCSDDGLEPNGAEEDCQWHDNIVRRCICGFRIKDPLAGPLYAYRNIFLENGEDFRNYMDFAAKPAVVFAYHNTCTASGAVSSSKVNGIGTPNYHYLNNLFWCRYWFLNSSATEPNWHGDFNVIARHEKDSRWPRMRALAARLKLDEHSLWTEADPGFTDFAKGDLSLREESPARGRGADLSRLPGQPLPGCEPGYFTGQAPDAGAVAFGRPMPRLPRKREEVTGLPAAGTWPPE